MLEKPMAIDRNKKGGDVDVCVDVVMSDPTANKNTRAKPEKVRERVRTASRR
jgi:hypothetical protein